MPTVTVSVQGLPELMARFRGADATIQRVFTDAINRAQITLQGQARIEAPVDQGDLRKGIVVAPVNGLIGHVLALAPYSFWVHEGRGPGKMPPVDVIEEWASTHGMPGAGFVIARKIAQSGTKPQPFFTKAVSKSTATLKGIWKDAADEVVRELA